MDVDTADVMEIYCATAAKETDDDESPLLYAVTVNTAGHATTEEGGRTCRYASRCKKNSFSVKFFLFKYYIYIFNTRYECVRKLFRTEQLRII